MASRKLTNANKGPILLDWLNNDTNRQDILYFMLNEMDGHNLVKEAFGRGLLIDFDILNEDTGKITFIDILT